MSIVFLAFVSVLRFKAALHYLFIRFLISLLIFSIFKIQIIRFPALEN